MRILAIDPGPTESAYVVFHGVNRLVFSKLLNEEILRVVAKEATRQPDCLVIERIGHYGTGMPAGQEVFDTCHWSGRFHQAWIDGGHPEDSIFLVKRGPVKIHLCGSARAKDGNVRQALIDRFGSPGTKKAPGVLYGVSGDVWQALALAVAFSEGVR